MALSEVSKALRTIKMETETIEHTKYLLTNPVISGRFQCATPERRQYLIARLDRAGNRIAAARDVIAAQKLIQRTEDAFISRRAAEIARTSPASTFENL